MNGNIDFSTLFGAGTSGQGTSDIMQWFTQLLSAQAGEDSPWSGYQWGGTPGQEGGPGPGGYGYYSGTGEGYDWESMNWGGWQEALTEQAGNIGQEGSPNQQVFWEQAQDMMQMMQFANLPGLTQDYQQGMTDVNAQMLSERTNLQKKYEGGAKGGRYGAIGSGGRQQGGGTRKQFLTDVYGLQQEQSQMQQGLQTDLTDAFFDNMGDWQSFLI